jgi:hypothetical protein
MRRARSGPPWIFFVIAAAFVAAGILYLTLGIRAKARGAYTVQIPAVIGRSLGDKSGNISPGMAIALGILCLAAAAFSVFLGFAFQ